MENKRKTVNFTKVILIAASPLLFIGTILLLAFFNAPGILQKMAELGLDELGFPQSTISITKIDWQKSRLVISDVSLGAKDNQNAKFDKLTIDWDWSDLLQYAPRLKKIRVVGMSLEAVKTKTGWQLSGLPLQKLFDDKSSEINAGLDRLELSDSQLRIRSADMHHDLKINKIILSDLSQNNKQHTIQIAWETNVDGFQLDGKGDIQTPASDGPVLFNLNFVKLDPGLLKRFAPSEFPLEDMSGKIDLNLLGKLDIKESNSSFSITSSAFTWTDGGAFSVLNNEISRRVEFASGQLNVLGGEFFPDTETLKIKEFNTDFNDVRIILPKEEGHVFSLKKLEGSGQLDMQGQPPLKGSLNSVFSVSGLSSSYMNSDVIRFESSLVIEDNKTAEDGPGISLKGKLEAAQPEWRDTETMTFTASHFVIPRLEYAPKSGIFAETAIFTSPHARSMGSEQWNISASSIDAQHITFDLGTGLNISELSPQDLKVETMAGNRTLPQSHNDKVTLPFPIKITRFSSNGDATFTWIDKTIEPNVALTAENVYFAIRKINSDSPKSYSYVSLKGDIDTFGKADIKGRIRPFDPTSSAMATLSLKDVDLLGLSGYVKDFIGVLPEAGNISIDTDVSLEDNKINATMDLILNGFKIAPKEIEKGTTLNELPLGVGLNLLKDEFGVIKLKLPVSGNLSDPKFDMSNTIEQTVGKVFKSSVETVVKVLFPPAAIGGAIFDLFTLINDKLSLVIPALTFKAGETDQVVLGGVKQLDLLSDLLLKHPNVNVSLCGVATQEDMDSASLKKMTLEKIAEARSHWAKKYILSLSNDIKSNRLVNCQKVEKEGANGAPRVEFVFR